MLFFNISPSKIRSAKGRFVGLLDKLLGKKPSYDFARDMLRTLEVLAVGGIRHDASTHSLQIGSADNTIYLDNAFSDYASAPAAERPQLLQRYAASFTQKISLASMQRANHNFSR